jgi:hypothetical protein
VSKTSKILKGEFPKKLFSLDQQVKIVNAAGDKLAERMAEGKSIDERANNLFLWLGSLNKDVQLYACQYLFNVKKIEFDADEKTEARLAFMEPHFEYGGEGYSADTFQSIDHRPWPVEYLDGTTFEERLESLAEEQGIEQTPVDLLLTGMPLPEMDTIQRFQLAQEAVANIVVLYEKYGKDNVLYLERLNRLFNWLMSIEDEIALYTFRWLLAGKRITFATSKIECWDEYAERFQDIFYQADFPENPT